MLDLLDGVRSGEQLAILLKEAGDSFANDIDFIRPQLAEWREARQAEPQLTADPDKQRIIDDLRPAMAQAPEDFNWSLLGNTLAYRLNMLPLEIRRTLQDATNCDTLWPVVVQAIFMADCAATITVITTAIHEQLTPGSTLPDWVRNQMSSLPGKPLAGPGPTAPLSAGQPPAAMPPFQPAPAQPNPRPLTILLQSNGHLVNNQLLFHLIDFSKPTGRVSPSTNTANQV